MIVRSSAAVMICSITLMNVAYAGSDKVTSTYMRGPVQQLSNYEIQCHDDFYQVAIEETRSGGLQKSVQLTRLDRKSKNIPQNLFDEVEQLFDEFKYISSISFSCGLGDKYEQSEELRPRKFLSVSVEGGHRESHRQAMEECLEKGLNFDFNTKRTLRIESDTVEIVGDKIGYCYGETEYFSVPIPLKETEGSNKL